ncbi:MAG TPA: pyruvate formate-lyase [Firmicutes bacterium]|jgi:pyruvate-formate lyase|nr:pyruvate formate-lyase [Bacillota bacterium]
MNERIHNLLQYVLNKQHQQFRQNLELDVADEFSAKELSDGNRITTRFERVLAVEKAVILPGERIVCLRTVRKIPEIFTEDEWAELKKDHYLHELGRVCNISSDYETTIQLGLEARRAEAQEVLLKCQANDDQEGQEFLQNVIRTINAIEAWVDSYIEEAKKLELPEVVGILERVPRYGARTFHEALQFFRILHFALWCSGNYHNTVGRFDQYMYPYLKSDLEAGRLDEDSAFELLEEFFISFSKDSDLYPGMQQGDNGQSLVLGGVDSDGNNVYNLLSEMCLKASLELKLIDPKINLRVDKSTPLAVYQLGTQLTKQGLGFPQYSNDDVVIPGLIAKGYALEDARNYVVAACWEFIIPKVGMDIPNIGALSYAKVVDRCLHRNLSESKDFSEFMATINQEIAAEVETMIAVFKNLYMEPSPIQSILMEGCIPQARDISKGSKYNNFGLHGTGIATAADSLAVIKKYVYETKTITSAQLIAAVDDNFEGHEQLQAELKYNQNKMGNDDDYVDEIACNLMTMFADALENKITEKGGIYRGGTGSAMYYIRHIQEIGASPDGRKKGEPLAANYSPGLNTRVNGPVSIIKSFSKPDLKRVINGGPLTLELHDTVFRNEEAIQKVALLVKSFMDMGGHQLQLNSVNRETLLDAQQNPDQYRNLIVRVWGWSGYFVELDREYQDHIIQRLELAI